ncbi:MAG: DUF4097 family beta strand repeat-containing protein [Acidobacteriia bacterium]|nr:DUF4097 family beta strand repeat-containing protein [Terriglobia bacterium]
MSTASPTPTPAPRYRPRSLFGPIVLVAIGVLFLAGNMGWIHWSNFGPWFARYWPLILIFWGVVKLGEYIWARQKGLPAPGIGAGGVVFLIFFILIGLAATRAAGVNWQAIGIDLDDVNVVEPFGIFGTSHEFSENVAQEIKPGEPVRVMEAHGSITVSASTDNQVHAFVHKYLRANSDDAAGRTNEATHPKLERQGDSWLMDMTAGGFTDGRFDIDLQVPAASPVTLTTRHGDLTVSQRSGDVSLESLHGDLKVEDIKGSVTLKTYHGEALVKGVSGDVTINGNASSLTVTDVKGTVTMACPIVRSIEMARLEKQVRFKSALTELQFARLDGDLSMDIGDLHANAITGPFRLDARVKDVHLEDMTGDVHIDSHRGDIDVRTKAPLGAMDINNLRGDITVGLPDNSGFQVDAESDQGEIHSDFDLTVNNQARNATGKGTVGKGGPMVRLKTNRGTIQIHKQ